MRTILAIPAYNCGKQLDRVLGSLTPEISSLFSDILVIDNISPDDTLQVALHHKSKISNLHVLRNKQNYSLGGSHKVAFLYAENVGATHVAILHGDDQAVVGELPALLEAAKGKPDIDAVLGTRFMKGSRLQGYDWRRIAGNRVLNILYTVVTGRRCRDLGSGLNIFKMDVFSDHVYLEFADRLTFNFELLLFLISKKANLLFFPITWRESDQVSNARNFNVAKIAFINLMKWRFGTLRYNQQKTPQDYESEEM